MNNKRRLGKTDIIVSEIGLGGFQLGEKIIINNEANATFGGMSEKDAIELVNKAVELGIIQLSGDQRTFLWGSTDRKLMNVPFDEHPYSALAAWFKTDEGMEIYTNIQKRLK